MERLLPRIVGIDILNRQADVGQVYESPVGPLALADVGQGHSLYFGETVASVRCRAVSGLKKLIPLAHAGRSQRRFEYPGVAEVSRATMNGPRVSY